MAFHEDELHFPLRGNQSPARGQSQMAHWYSHRESQSSVSQLSSILLPQPLHAEVTVHSPTDPRGKPLHAHRQNQKTLSTESTLSIESTGLHPGYPGPNPTWPLDFPYSSRAHLVGGSDAANKEAEQSESSSAAPPDGGIVAWLQVLGSYFLFFNTWGLINAFGVFQTYYREILIPDKSNSTIAWIGTLTSFLLCASPVSWGPIFDVGSPRRLVVFGSASVVLGIMMTSLCTTYWQLMLAQGICCGIGGGALFITATSILPSYFSKKRALAMGISASGSSLGGIIYPIVFTYVQPTIGFGWAVRIIGIIAILTLLIPCIVIKPLNQRSMNKDRPANHFRKIFNPSILQDLSFQIMNTATFLGFVGQYIPYFFIEQFASSPSRSFPEHLRFWLLIFLNVGSIPGRIIPSLLADKAFHPLKVLATTTLGATILAFCWIAIKHSVPGLIVWCLLYGFCSGAFVSLQGAAVASMAMAKGDLTSIGTRFGINMFCAAMGILIGSPVGGAIFPHSWVGAQVFCGVTLLLATVAIAGTYVAFQRSQRRTAMVKSGG